MKPRSARTLGTWGTTAALLLAATTARAQPRPLSVEAGVVMGIVAQPYATLGVAAGPWAVRLSGTTGLNRCSDGVQLNTGRVIRDADNTKHTIGAMFAQFHDRCGQPYAGRVVNGRYAGIVYDFQVKGFFIETGIGFGARNPVNVNGAPFDHVYGQMGFVHRFGKQYT